MENGSISAIDTVIVLAYLLGIMAVGILAGSEEHVLRPVLSGRPFVSVAADRRGAVLRQHFHDSLRRPGFVGIQRWTGDRQLRVDGVLLPDPLGIVLSPFYFRQQDADVFRSTWRSDTARGLALFWPSSGDPPPCWSISASACTPVPR